FIVLMTGAAEFAIYVLQDGALKIAFQPSDEHRLAGEPVIPADDPLFAVIVDERRLVWAALPDDAALLGQRGDLAGALVESHAPERVIGMLVIGGSALDDTPDEIERKFHLTASELSRLAGRIQLIERWQAASAASGHEPSSHVETNGQSNGRGATAASPAPEGAGVSTKERRPQGGRELTLQ